LRLRVDLTDAALARFRTAREQAKEGPLAHVVDRVAQSLGAGPRRDFNTFVAAVQKDADEKDVKLTPKRSKLLQSSLAVRDESAEPVIRKIHKPGKIESDPLHGPYATKIDGKRCVVEYEPDPELRDTEQVPLLEDGGIEAFIRREVLPHTPDAWIDESATRIGYEISFTRYFYKPQRLRTLHEIKADIHTLQAD
jgi:type I restriction enzyme M protein